MNSLPWSVFCAAWPSLLRTSLNCSFAASYVSKSIGDELLWLALNTKDNSSVAERHEKWHYNKIPLIDRERWTHTKPQKKGSGSKANARIKLWLRTCFQLGSQKCWTSQSLLSFPSSERSFVNVIALEHFCVITNSRQQYLPWQDLNVTLRAIQFHMDPTNCKCILWK